MNRLIFIDESGDLGWTLDKPYRAGGSSQHLTISAVSCYENESGKISRFMRDLYKSQKWPPKEEMKWAMMSDESRWIFAQKANHFCLKEKEIQIFSMTCRKDRVRDHIRSDSNKLYNYIIKLMLLGHLSAFDQVTLHPDPRSIKVNSGNSLHDYIQTTLWFETNAATLLNVKPSESRVDKGVQFCDMIAGLVQSHFEDRKSDPFRQFRRHIAVNTLFF